MKIAVLLCGQARFFRKGYPSIQEHILNVYNPDIYIHTWTSPTNTFSAAPWNNLGTLTITPTDLEEYIQLYKPVRYKIEETLENIPLRRSYERTSSPQTRYNYYCYLYSLRECFKLVEISYDMFIVLRSDVVIYRMPTLRPSFFHIWNRFPARKDVLEAMVCAVPGNKIEIFVSLIDKLETYYDSGYAFNYEEMTHAHFTECKLYQQTLLFSKNAFEWGYIRNFRIQRM